MIMTAAAGRDGGSGYQGSWRRAPKDAPPPDDRFADDIAEALDQMVADSEDAGLYDLPGEAPFEPR